jgi:hypothetical protein
MALAPPYLGSEVGLNARRPSLLEADAADGGEHVDAPRFDANLETGTGLRQVILLESHQWRTELAQRGYDPRRVGGGGLDPDVEVLRGARSPMHADRISADDHKPRISVE